MTSRPDRGSDGEMATTEQRESVARWAQDMEEDYADDGCECEACQEFVSLATALRALIHDSERLAALRGQHE